MQARLLAFMSVATVVVGSTSPQFWNTKDASVWTHEDAEQMMRASPWAKERPMPISERRGVSYLDANTGVGPVSPPAPELGNSQEAGNTLPPSGHKSAVPSAPIGAPEIQPFLRIIWASALPVRLAALRLRTAGTEPTAEQLARAEKDPPNYVIAVVGLPAPEADSKPQDLAKTAFLSIRGKTAVVAIDSEYRRIADSDVYFFRFPKAALPLTISEGDVEFRLSVGRMNLRQKFQLAGMTFRGQLAL